jgi:hypothetical protein
MGGWRDRRAVDGTITPARGSPIVSEELETIMTGYHDLIVKGRREIFKIEG